MLDLQHTHTHTRELQNRSRAGSEVRRTGAHPLVVQLGVVQEHSAHVGIELDHHPDVPETQAHINTI